ncbi:MAG: serine hydrolase [Parasphingorhabdus sp.]|uniref:serine hydrolase n=1 Tax=Parasphingorhabdus sp. TaxID=2709688 RepID=UPI0030026B56
MPNRPSRFWIIAAFVLTSAFSAPSYAQTVQISPVSSEYQSRADKLLEILKGSQKEESFFASSFLDAVPLTQFRNFLSQINIQYGQPVSIRRIIPASNTDGTVEISYTKAIVAMRMVLDSNAPHPVIGLQVTGANINSDSIQKITEEFRDLPGIASFQIADLSGAKIQTVAAFHADKQLAIGSTFKLYILAELSRSIAAKEHRWSDVVTLDRKSLPSGVLQNWPDGAPLTLQTLATLMISISDNSATDILINALGRKNIEEMLRLTGHAQSAKTIPLLTTLEMFALKMPANDDLREAFVAASEDEQQRLIETKQDRLDLPSVSISNLANKPLHIDTIEWFASPADISKLLHYIAKTGDPVVRDILKINPIIPPGDALRWVVIGAKGGSEPGVISFAFLTESHSGKTYAVSGSWNNNQIPVDATKFISMMNRLLNLTAAR